MAAHNISSPLSIEASKFQLLRNQLLERYPQTDDETLAGILEGITDLHEMIAAIIRSALVDEALGSGLRTRLDDMKERQSRLAVRASKKRELALHAMSETGLAKLEQPDFTASIRAGVPALVVVSEQVIPEAYWLTQPPKLDRQGSHFAPILERRARHCSQAGRASSVVRCRPREAGRHTSSLTKN
jgi:Siphovirus Gp157